eukprot:GFYU01000173.1.p1 GENE.GFYU01000173.1~~GFYU01000173.1.p1  ORF type:complete len:514 (-),score=117.78 GFYU01000173.1:271-1812(-)
MPATMVSQQSGDLHDWLDCRSSFRQSTIVKKVTFSEEVKTRSTTDDVDGSPTASRRPQGQRVTLPLYPHLVPRVHEAVMVRVASVQEDGIRVHLPEFGMIEAYISVAALSRKRKTKAGQSPLSSFKQGQHFPALTVAVNTTSKNTWIDLSKVELLEEARQDCHERFAKTQSVLEVFHYMVMHSNDNITMDYLIENVAWPLHSRYSHSLHVFHQVVRGDPSVLEPVRVNISDDAFTLLIQAIHETIRPCRVPFITNSNVSSDTVTTTATVNKKMRDDSSTESACNDAAANADTAVDAVEGDAEGDAEDNEFDRLSTEFAYEVGGIVRDAVNALKNESLPAEDILNSVRLQVMMMRHPYKMSLSDCASSILTAVLQTAVDGSRREANRRRKNSAEVVTPVQAMEVTKERVTAALQVWHGLLKNLVRDDNDKLELVFTLEELCCNSKWVVELQPLFAHILYALYEEEIDLIDEDTILAWADWRATEAPACSASQNQVVAGGALMKQCEPLISWLKA